MAKASDESSRSDLLLLYAARAFVARHCQPQSLLEAERLIIEYANKEHFKRIAWDGDERIIEPRGWGTCNPELGVYVPVDFDRNTVKYIRTSAAEADWYSIRLAQDDLLKPYQGPSYQEMRNVRLARVELLSMLRELGLLVSSEQSAASESWAPRDEPPKAPAPRGRRPKSKRKAKSRDDRHAFDYEGTRALAKEASQDGADDRPGLFYDRVRGLCDLRRPRIKAPPDRRTMGRYIGDIYRDAKRAAKSRPKR
jgi:hypothetical protein